MKFREAWVSLCEGTNDIKPMARMNKILIKQEFHEIAMLLKADGTYTNTPSELIKLFAYTHFIDSPLPPVACAFSNNNGSIINKYINKKELNMQFNSLDQGCPTRRLHCGPPNIFM